MAIFGPVTAPKKDLRKIDLGDADIMMELLEELAIATATYDWIKTNQPHHPEAKEIQAQAHEVFDDLVGIMKGEIKDDRINRHSDWKGADLIEHLEKGEGKKSDFIVEETLARFIDAFIDFSHQTDENGAPLSRLKYYAFMSGWAHYLAGLAPNETPPKGE